MNKITVLISDDHSIVRAGLRALLEGSPEFLVVGEATNGHQAVKEAKRLLPDVALLDLAMPLLNGVEAARQIARESPRTQVLVLSAYNDDQHLRQALQAGVTGYLVKETAARDLLLAVRDVAQGNAYFSPSISQRLLTQWRGSLQKTKPSSTDATGLSRRQTEVFQLIAEGHLTKQIADILSLKLKTVEKHRESLMRKLDMHNIAALTRHAIFSGTIESGAGPDLGSVAA
jgi:DNA-binding NarL/FixJ family response regulator